MRTTARTRSTGFWLVPPLPRLLPWIRRWHRTVRDRRRLAVLNDHELRDIGLTRDEALREAARPFWDSPPP